MLYTIINLDDVYYNFENKITSGSAASSNPYDYIRHGYFIDNASLFGGIDNVSFNCDNTGYITGDNMGVSRK